MDDSPLKTKLQQCESGPFYRSKFSISHRGAPLEFPEHSHESYEAAYRMGAGVIECDVTFTKDGEGRIVNRDEFIKFSDNLITSREHAVLKLIVEGFTNQQIAETLHISVRTVDTHRANMLTKLKLANTAMLVRFAVENKLV